MTRLVPVLALIALAPTAVLPVHADDDPPATPPLPAGTVRPAIDFELLADGTRPTWDALSGQPVVLDFWASWCGPCVAAFPKLNELAEEFADSGLRFFSVTYEPEPFVREFVAQHGLTTEVGLDADFATFEAFNAWGIPVAYLIDADGRLVQAIHPDDLDETSVRAFLAGEPLTAEPAAAWPDPEGAREYFGSLRDELADRYTGGL